jgi:excisionase family DNA binding protein
MDEKRLTITVEEAARLLGISRGLAYEMVRAGKIPSIRFGKRLVVPRRALEQMLGEAESVSNSQQK